MRPIGPALGVVGFAALTAACSTPQYPVRENYVAPAPIKPEYPIKSGEAPASPPSEATPPPATSASAVAAEPQQPATTVAAPSPGPVESAPLPAASTSGSTASTMSTPAPAQPAPAPASTSPSSPVQSPPAAAYAAPPAAAYTPPPPVRRREPVVRFVTAGKVVEPHAMFRDYVVRRGDHVDAIARDLDTTRQALIEANDLRPPYSVRPGKHLKIPVAKAYQAQGGDTLANVAKRFGIGLAQLADLNDLPEKARLTAGMLIALPARYDDHGPTRITETAPAYVESRPRTTFAAAPPAPQTYASRPAYRTAPAPAYASGPYVPSPAALAAAAALRARVGPVTSEPGSATTAYRPPAAAYPVESSRSSAPPRTTAAAVISAGQGRFVWPVRGDILLRFGSVGFGRRNDGLDIKSPMGGAVRAAAGGEVVYAGDQVPGFGNLVLIKHADGWVTAYAHLGSVDVHMRQTWPRSWVNQLYGLCVLLQQS